MKGKATSESQGFHDLTDECVACGEEHVGVGVPVFMLVPGMLMPSVEYDVAVFVPDPDAKIVVLEMPNGQHAYVTDNTIVKVAHQECIQDLIDDASNITLYNDEEDEEDDDE